MKIGDLVGDFLDRHIVGIMIFFISAISCLIIIPTALYFAANYYSKDSIVIIKVLDKYEDTYVTYNPTTKMPYTNYEYYIVWDKGEIEVSESEYNDINEGDDILITKTTVYDKRTDEVYKIYYKYGAEINNGGMEWVLMIQLCILPK